MKISIRNYRGIAAVDFDHDKITLVAGRNHQGKTSIAEALASALTGDTIARTDILKSKMKGLVRDGSKEGYVRVTVGAGQVSRTWPAGTFQAFGENIKNISLMAAGQESLLDYKRPERALLLAKFLDAEPTLAEVETELKAQNIAGEVIGQLLEKLKVNGFDTMFARAREVGTSLRGKWEEVTGEKYGSQKANGWQPPEFAPRLETMDEESLAEIADEIKAVLESGIAAAAIAGMEKKTFQDQVKLLPALRNYLKVIEGKLEAEKKNETDLTKKLYLMEGVEKEIACPHCGGLCIMKGGALVPAAILDEVETLRREEDKKMTLAALQTARDNARGIITDLSEKRSELAAAEKAERELNRLAGLKVDPDAVVPESVDDIRKQLAAAETDLRVWRAWKRAGELQENISQNKIICDVLAPSGIRQVKLSKTMSDFNRLAADLARAASWPEVRIDKDYDIYHGERLVSFCSSEEIFEARTVLQLAVARLEKAATVIIDGADIITGREDRNGMIQAILFSEVPAVICMSLKEKSELPPLEKLPGGAAFWVEKGEFDGSK